MEDHAGHDHAHEEQGHTQTPAVVPTGKHTDRERILGAISYIGPLFIVSYLMAENSKFVKFHASQGLVFFLAVLIVRFVLGGIMMAVIAPSVILTESTGAIGMMYGGAGIVGLVMMIINLGLLILAIFGIVKAAQGEEWGMPVIGAWARKLKM